MNGYFKVALVDGSELDFDKECNSVNYTDGRYVIFKHEEPTNRKFEILAIIPNRSIMLILKVKED